MSTHVFSPPLPFRSVFLQRFFQSPSGGSTTPTDPSQRTERRFLLKSRPNALGGSLVKPPSPSSKGRLLCNFDWLLNSMFIAPSPTQAWFHWEKGHPVCSKKQQGQPLGKPSGKPQGTLQGKPLDSSEWFGVYRTGHASQPEPTRFCEAWESLEPAASVLTTQ